MASQEIIPDDEVLVKGCLENNRKSQELLYRKFSVKMYHHCLSYTGDRDTAKDILQEAFIKVFKRMGSFSPGNSLEGWIRRIITNTAIDYYRKGKINARFESLEEVAAIVDPGAVEGLTWNTEVILGYIKKLPEGARLIFNLFAIEGYSHKEIASRLNITEGTSKSQYNRARTLLQGWLKQTA